MKTRQELKELKDTILCYNREELLIEFKEHFTIFEVCCPHALNLHGENRCWSFFDDKLLANILFMRRGIGKSFNANNWSKGGIYDERGIRCNLCEINQKKTKKGISYMSAHTGGKGLDFKVKNMKSSDVRKWATENAELFPYKCRFEWKMNGYEISWIHHDTYDEPQNPKVYLFNI